MEMLAKIGIPPDTRVYAIVRAIRDDEYGWQVWIAVDKLSKPVQQWNGTFMWLTDVGHVYRVTVYPNGEENVLHIRTV